MKTARMFCLLGASLAAPAALAAAEFRASYGNWAFDVSGRSVTGGQSYDFRRDLDAQRTAKRSFEVSWDTGPGWWKPDLAFGDAKIGASGSHTESTFVALPPPLPPSSRTRTVSTRADFRDQDYIARYPVKRGTLQLSAGVAIKHLNGSIVVDDSSQSQPSRGDYDETFPELHLRARWPVARWLELQATGQGIQYQDSKAFEWRAGLALEGGPLMLEALWQEKRYDIEVGENSLDVKLAGPLLRAGVTFR